MADDKVVTQAADDKTVRGRILIACNMNIIRRQVLV